MTAENIEINWEPCKLDPAYEIATTTPHQIRKISNERIIKETEHGDGYLEVHLSKKKFYKHVVVATQFIDNPENLPFIDHINHIRSDNRIENLRWCTHKHNCNQRANQTFIDKLPDEAIVVDNFNGWEFEDLYYHDNTFYAFNGINYVVKRRYEHINGTYSVQYTDKAGIKRTIYYSKFKREFELI